MDPKERQIWIVVALLLAAAIGYVAWSMKGEKAPEGDTTPESVACTMEAKQCPDGSYVGRQGPKCEFAPCPGPAVEVQVK